MTSRTRVASAAPGFDVRGFAYGSIAAALLTVALLSGCNTAKGIGDDVEEAAEEVGDAID